MNHLAFMEVLMQELPDRLSKAEFMADVFDWLRTFKSIGDFTAYQLLLNLSYSDAMNFSDHDFVVISIGSRRGLQRCFGGNIPRSAEVDLVRWMQSSQGHHFSRLGLTLNGLGDEGRPMMLCDIEHTLCELDKYIRRCNNPVQKGQPFRGTGSLGKIRLPKAWCHEDRHTVRIRNKVEAETEALEMFVVESIVGHRLVNGVQEFLVLWQGYGEDEATWEPEDSLMEDVPKMIKAFWKSLKVSAFCPTERQSTDPSTDIAPGNGHSYVRYVWIMHGIGRSTESKYCYRVCTYYSFWMTRADAAPPWTENEWSKLQVESELTPLQMPAAPYSPDFNPWTRDTMIREPELPMA